MTNAVSCSNLLFKRGERTYLEDVNFELPQGHLMGLLGHNGAGKSTLIKLILGLLKKADGELTVLGAAPGASPLSVGYLPESVTFYDAMTVREHLVYFARLKGVSKSRIDELVGGLGLEPVIDQRLGQCSKGQRQRLGLAQALLSKPRLLMLDEPTVGLDPAASLGMYQELSALRDAGCSIIVCTHELALIEPYLDTALLMAEGRVRAQGSMDELQKAAGLPTTFMNVPVEQLAGDARFAGLIEGSRLHVPDAETADIVKILTNEFGCYDFQVRRADLGAIFKLFVLDTIAAECDK